MRIVTLLLLVFLAGSCKKKFSCLCSDGASTYTKEVKGKDADEACNDAEDLFLGYPTESCVPA